MPGQPAQGWPQLAQAPPAVAAQPAPTDRQPGASPLPSGSGLFTGQASVPPPPAQGQHQPVVGLHGYQPPRPPGQAPAYPAPPHQQPQAPAFPEPPHQPQPYGQPPVSGLPASAHPVSGQPVSSPPVSGLPVSGQPVSAHPISGGTAVAPGHAGPPAVPASTEPPTPAQWSPPQQRIPWTDPPATQDGQTWQPRITPSPPRKPRLGLGILIGVLVGLLVFGTAGFFAGRATAPEPKAQPTASATPRPTGSLPAYEAGQLELNRKKFTGDLATLAEPWLAVVGGCSNSADQFGPKLDAGEQTRVFCELNNLSVFFVQYKSIADRDAKRATRQKQNTDAQALTPGAAGPSQKSTPSGKATGNYIEYAYRGGSGNQARTTSGVWWEMDKAPVAAFIEVYWSDIGEKWDPLRDVWQRYS